MNKKNSSKGHTGSLLLVLIALIFFWSLMESSPIYYKNILSLVSSTYDVDIPLITESKPNSNIRKSLRDGSSISFMYNYSPSERSWDTMYTYVIYSDSRSTDYKFYCTRLTLERGNEDLCSCYYSERIWNELLDLILNNEELVECKSTYDSNGKVLDVPIPKTVSIDRGVYSPRNIDAIEAYFKQLAINAGASPADLNMNIKVDDKDIVDKESVTSLNGDFVYKPVGRISDTDKQELEDYLRQKYNETGVRMYIILYDNEDVDLLQETAKKMIDRATSPAMVFGLTASENQWVFRYQIDPSRESSIRDEYSKVADAFWATNENYTKRLKNAIDKAYALY